MESDNLELPHIPTAVPPTDNLNNVLFTIQDGPPGPRGGPVDVWKQTGTNDSGDGSETFEPTGTNADQAELDTTHLNKAAIVDGEMPSTLPQGVREEIFCSAGFIGTNFIKLLLAQNQFPPAAGE